MIKIVSDTEKLRLIRISGKSVIWLKLKNGPAVAKHAQSLWLFLEADINEEKSKLYIVAKVQDFFGLSLSVL